MSAEIYLNLPLHYSSSCYFSWNIIVHAKPAFQANLANYQPTDQGVACGNQANIISFVKFWFDYQARLDLVRHQQARIPILY